MVNRKYHEKWRYWKLEDYPKNCPKCGFKTKLNKFDNGVEVYCSNYMDGCYWEIWVPNPYYPDNDPTIRCLTIEMDLFK